MVSGWGTTESDADPDMGEDGDLPELLHYAHTRYVAAKECAADFAREGAADPDGNADQVFDPATALW